MSVLSGMLVGAEVRAQPAVDPNTLSLIFENDLFADTDRNYTNGVAVTWLGGIGQTPDLVLRAARLFPLFPEIGTVRTSYALGQAMYTPSDITLENPPADDRPYAGWLYGSVGLLAETGQRLDRLELTLGVVGPAAGAERTQKRVHEIVGSPRPEGWDTQLKNEPTLLLTYQRSWRSYVARDQLFDTGLGFDLTPHAGGALGNVFTYANFGATARFGWNLPRDYGAPRIQPSLPGSGFFEPEPGFAWYAFAGLEGRTVARNIFLDGNTFENGPSVDKEPLVGDLQFGVAATFDQVRLTYTTVLRTPEFEGRGGSGNFGAVSLSLRF